MSTIDKIAAGTSFDLNHQDYAILVYGDGSISYTQGNEILNHYDADTIEAYTAHQLIKASNVKIPVPLSNAPLIDYRSELISSLAKFDEFMTGNLNESVYHGVLRSTSALKELLELSYLDTDFEKFAGKTFGGHNLSKSQHSTGAFVYDRDSIRAANEGWVAGSKNSLLKVKSIFENVKSPLAPKIIELVDSLIKELEIANLDVDTPSPIKNR